MPATDLTPDQQRAVEMSPRENRLILGGPGSGKTQILLHRAGFLRRAYNAGDDDYHVFVYTRILNEYIKSALDLLDLPETSVSTLDGWCYDYYQSRIPGPIPWNKAAKMPDFPAIRRAVASKAGTEPPPYRFVLVDEGQDLAEDAFDVLKVVAGHITVCMDFKQQIYDQGSTESQVRAYLGIRKENVTLLAHFRSCPYINLLAAQLLDQGERGMYLRQASGPTGERATPLVYIAGDADDEKARLCQVLRGRVAKGERVAILVPYTRLLYGLARGLKELGLDVEPVSRDLPNFGSDAPKIITYHSAKGLTFDSVFLPRLTSGAFRLWSDERIRKLIFVGISRAVNWVYLSTTSTTGLPIWDRILPLESQGYLTVQRSELTLDLEDVADDTDEEDAMPY